MLSLFSWIENPPPFFFSLFKSILIVKKSIGWKGIHQILKFNFLFLENSQVQCSKAVDFILTLKYIDIFFISFYFNSHPLCKFRKGEPSTLPSFRFPSFVNCAEFWIYSLTSALFKIINIGELTNTPSLTFSIVIPVIDFTLKEGKRLLFAPFSFLYSCSIWFFHIAINKN